jgi:hypothetical protein
VRCGGKQSSVSREEREADQRIWRDGAQGSRAVHLGGGGSVEQHGGECVRVGSGGAGGDQDRKFERWKPF